MFVPRSSSFLYSTRALGRRVIGLPKTGLSTATRFFSATLSDETHDQDDNDKHTATTPQYYTGRVYAYDRQKCFGHISLHDAFGRIDHSKDRIFVHRADIVSDLDYNDFPQAPHLKKLDSVRFQIQQDGQRTKATHVTFQNGKPIPPLRPTWWVGRRRNIYETCFAPIAQVLDTESDDDNDNDNGNGETPKLTDAQKLAAFEQAATQYRQMKQQAIDLAEQVGMKLSDFPTELTGRGENNKKTSSTTNDNTTAATHESSSNDDEEKSSTSTTTA